MNRCLQRPLFLLSLLAAPLVFLAPGCRSADPKARSADAETEDESPYPPAPAVAIGTAIASAQGQRPQCRFVHAEFEPVDEDEDEGARATARWLVILADKDCMRVVYVDAANGTILSSADERQPEALAFLEELARDAERPAIDVRSLLDAGTARVPGAWVIAASVNPPHAPAPYSVFLVDGRLCKQAFVSKDAVVVELRDTRFYGPDEREEEEQMEALQRSRDAAQERN